MNAIIDIQTSRRKRGPLLMKLSQFKPYRTFLEQVSGIVLALALCAGSQAAYAQTWETVDDIDAPSAGAREVISDSAGRIFVCGSMKDETARHHAVIMRSGNGGATWETSADYPAVIDGPIGPPGSAAGFSAIASAQLANGENHMVAAGRIEQVVVGGRFSGRLLVIRSKDAGTTWETVDEYVHPTYSQISSNTFPGGAAIDNSGNIYVVCSAQEKIVSRKTTTTVNHWLIRKGSETATGLVWTTVGDFPYTVGKDWELFNHPATAVACVGDDVFVVGGGGGSWIVRKSSNGGLTWLVVDTFRLSTTDNSHAFGLAADSLGTLYVAGLGGQVLQKTSRPQWIVRRGTNGGTSWSTADQFQGPNGGGQAYGVTVDGNDKVHVTGTAWAGTSSSLRHWMTRSNATGTWATTDDFSLASTKYSEGEAITVDPSGNLFASGLAFDAGGVYHGWMVRRNPSP